MSENFFDSRHYRALSRLHPLQMDLEEYAVCKELDRALESADGVYREIFPSSAIATLEKWETLYELGHSGTIEARRAALLEAINRDSGIAERHYKALAASMGFEIDIVKPPRMLRTGLGRAGFEIYDPDEQYTWTVTSDHPQHGIYRIVDLLEAKQHQTVEEVDLNALAHNFKFFKSFLKPTTRTVANSTGLPFSSTTVPVIFTLAATAASATMLARSIKSVVRIFISLMNILYRSLYSLFIYNSKKHILFPMPPNLHVWATLFTFVATEQFILKK